MNLLFEYLYRDADNYKAWSEVIRSNKNNLSIIHVKATIEKSLIDALYFDANQAGLPALQPKQLNP